MREKYGWHFITRSMRLGYEDGRKVVLGKWIEMRNGFTPELCVCGMHASERIVHAGSYHSGPILCRVIVRGEISEDDYKFVGRRRKVIWHRELGSDVLRRIVRGMYGELGIVPIRIGESSRSELFARCKNPFGWRKTSIAWSGSHTDDQKSVLSARFSKLAEHRLREWAREHGCPPRR